jgi:hypothetical protein
LMTGEREQEVMYTYWTGLHFSFLPRKYLL